MPQSGFGEVFCSWLALHWCALFRMFWPFFKTFHFAMAKNENILATLQDFNGLNLRSGSTGDRDREYESAGIYLQCSRWVWEILRQGQQERKWQLNTHGSAFDLSYISEH